MRVALVADDPLARGGLAAAVASDPDLAVGAQLTSAEADRAAGADAVLWDLGPAAESLDALRTLEGVGPPIVVLAADEPTAAEALAAGARGVLVRDATPERIAGAVRAVARGLWVIDDALSEVLRPRLDQSAQPREPLTPRELQVLELVSRGFSNRIIAARLGISEHTAKFHVNAILAKLGARNRTDALARAARLGLVVL